MMRLLLVAFLGLAVAQLENTYFEGGREYLYKYETQIVNGVPEISETVSAVKVRAQVRVQLETRAQFLVKLEQIEIARINGLIEELNPNKEQIPIEKMEPLSPEELAIMTRPLSTEFKFTYNKGNVVEFFADPTEPHWAVNIKRGVVNMFQVNLDQSKPLDKPEPTWSSRAFLTTPENAYRTMEVSPAGECETMYEIHAPKESPLALSMPLLQVTKVRNFQNCVERPRFFVQSVIPKKCENCEPEAVEPMIAASTARIVISGDRSHFLLRSAIIESKYTFIPNADPNAYAVTNVNQTLVLESGPRPMTPLSAPVSLAPLPLIAAVPELEKQIEELMGKDPEAKFPANPATSPMKILKAKEILEAVVAVLEDNTLPLTSTTPCGINELIEIVRNMSKTEVNQLYRECTVQSVFTHPRAVNAPKIGVTEALLRILPMAATPAAIEVVVTAIQAQVVPATVATEIVSACALHVYSPEAIKKLWELENCQYHSSPIFKRTLHLTLASCVQKMKVLSEQKEEELMKSVEKIEKLQQISPRAEHPIQKRILTTAVREIVQVREEVEQLLVALIEKNLQSPSETDKLMALRCLGNVALKRAIAIVKPLIQSPATPILIRQSAVIALQKTAKVHPNLVIEALLPVFMDQSVSEDVRVPAYYTIASSEPQFHVLQLLAHSLNNETNTHVGSFVYRHLLSISNSTYPCLAEAAKNATLCLPFTKPFEDPSCRYEHFPYYNAKTKTGVAIDVATIASPRSMIPKSAFAKVQANKLGVNLDVLEIGYNSEGLESILDKIVPSRSMFRDPVESDFLTKIKDELKIKNRFVPTSINGFMYVKILGQEFTFQELDPATLLNVLNREIIVKRTVPTLLSHHKYITPTECGLPFMADLKTTSIVRVDAQIKTNLPALSAELNIKPTVAVEIHGVMGIDATVFKAAVSTKTQINADKITIASTIRVDKATKKIVAALEMPEKEKLIVRMESVAETLFKLSPIHTKKPMAEVRKIAATNVARTTPIEFTLPAKFMGAKVSIIGEKPINEATITSLPSARIFPLMGRTLAYVKYEPVKPVEKLELVAVLAPPQPAPQPIPAYSPRYQPQPFPEPIDASMETLIKRLRPEILHEAEAVGVVVAVNAVAGPAKTPIVQVEAICQRSTVHGHRYHCTSLLTRAPLLPRETQPWKAHAKIEIQYPMEPLPFNQLLTVEHQQRAQQMLNDVLRRDGLYDELINARKSQITRIYERIVRNLTYDAPAELFPQTNINWPQQTVASPAVQQIIQAAEEVNAKQQKISFLLSQLKSEAFRQSSPWAPYAAQSVQIKQIIQECIQNIREVTQKLEMIKQRLPMLPTQQTEKIHLIRCVAKIQNAIQQQEQILQKYEISSIKPLAALYPYVASIERECQQQKQVVAKITKEVQQQQQSSWWSTSVLNQPAELKTLQLQEMLNFHISAADTKAPAIVAKQAQCVRKLHAIINANKKAPLRPEEIAQKLQEIMPMIEAIEQEIIAYVQPELQLAEQPEPQREEQIKRLPMASVRKLIRVQGLLPINEMIIDDLRNLIKCALLRPMPILPEIKQIMEVRAQKEAKCLELSAQLKNIAVEHARSLWKISPEETPMQSHPRHASVLATVTFGEGTPDQVLNAKIIAMRSPEQLMWEIAQACNATRDPRVMRIVAKEPVRDIEYQKLVEEVEEEMNSLQSVWVNAKYPTDMCARSPETCTVAEMAINLIKYLSFPKMSAAIPAPADVTPGVLNVWANLCSARKHVHVLLVRPSEAIKIEGIPAPALLQNGIPTRPYHIRSPAPAGECSIESNVIKTFDSHVFSLPTQVSPMCEKVVVADCSDRNALAITIRQEPSTLKTIAKIVVGQHQIEIEPSIYAPIVRLDAQPITIPEQVVKRVNIRYQGAQEQVEILRIRDIVEVKVPAIGLVVKAVANKIHIQPSAYFRTRLCGLCGNFDSNPATEYMDPSLVLHQKSESFAMTYLRPSPRCPVQQYQRLFTPITSACNLEHKHDVFTQLYKTCISTTAVKSCPSSCLPKTTSPRVIQYYCSESGLPSTQDLVALAQTQQIHTLIQKEVHQSRRIQEAVSCQPRI